MFDAAYGGVDDQATGEAGKVIHRGPQMLDVPRLLPHQPALEIGHCRHCRLVGTAGIGFAYAMDTLVGLDLYEKQISISRPYQEGLDVGDLDGGASPDLRRSLEERRRSHRDCRHRPSRLPQKLPAPHNTSSNCLFFSRNQRTAGIDSKPEK